MDKQIILNLGGGKLKPPGLEEMNNYFLVNVDSIYQHNSEGLSYIYSELKKFLKDKNSTKELFSDSDIFDFLESWLYPVDKIYMHRFLEHVKRNEILYFIYLLSTVCKIGSEIDIIVPNYASLAKRIINEDPFAKNFVEEDIITSTELFNEPDMPHCSIWTPLRAKYYFELEKRFEIKNMQPIYVFDGRDIYMKFTAVRK